MGERPSYDCCEQSPEWPRWSSQGRTGGGKEAGIQQSLVIWQTNHHEACRLLELGTGGWLRNSRRNLALRRSYRAGALVV